MRRCTASIAASRTGWSGRRRRGATRPCSDRKGRKVKVERYGEKKVEEPVQERRGRSRFKDRPANRDARNPSQTRARRRLYRGSGPRPSRPRPKD